MLNVRSRHCALSAACPLYPQKRTSGDWAAMSAKCQKRTSLDYSITSSAWPSSVMGKVRPSVLTDLRPIKHLSILTWH